MYQRSTRARGRDPEGTREAILAAAAETIHRSGFRGTDVDTILARAGVTKGALYHHFRDKEALGYAVVDESLARLTREKWVAPLRDAANPLDALIAVVESTSVAPEEVRCGCPVNNLAQEMSPLDEGFRERLARVFDAWQEGIAAGLRAGRKRGQVRRDVDPEEAATFFVALYEGYISLAKTSRDPNVLRAGKRAMARHLDSLRAGGPRRVRR
jgi:TetR/AcrR family transcriptional repressor of nem operon